MDARLSWGRTALVGALSLGIAACNDRSDPGGNDGGGGDDGGTPTDDLDSDNDRLTNGEESGKYHTDPHNPDSDGDGFSDGDEVLDHGTNPNNEYHRPYRGNYKIGDCATYPDKSTAGPTESRLVDLGGSGLTKVALYEPGNRIRNEQLVDQYGERVDLYSFCGVNLDIYFFQWNQFGATPEYAALTCWIEDMLNVQEYYRDYGYQLVIVLTQNSATELPTKDDVAALAAMLGAEDIPVLAGVDESMFGFHTWFEKDFHEPTLVHIGRELNVLSVDNDDCSGVDRDPCPYMTTVPEGKCWPTGPDASCELLDLACACPAPACEDYCGQDNCPNTY
jgi:hypothetical protein